jgi:hypothetical protein
VKQDRTLNLKTLNGVKGKEDVKPQANGKQALLKRRLAVVVNHVLQPHTGFDVLLPYTLNGVLQSILLFHPNLLNLKSTLAVQRIVGNTCTLAVALNS